MAAEREELPTGVREQGSALGKGDVVERGAQREGTKAPAAIIPPSGKGSGVLIETKYCSLHKSPRQRLHMLLSHAHP